jgi:hypothetical protein
VNLPATAPRKSIPYRRAAIKFSEPITPSALVRCTPGAVELEPSTPAPVVAVPAPRHERPELPVD